jgi:hypothetical protein
MAKTFLAVPLFLAYCFVSLLSGCHQQPSWHLAASKQGDTVQLCLSNELECPQPQGVRPAGISVYRYDSLHDNELVWDTEPENPITNGTISGLVTYGIPPKNWSNKVTAPALTCGKAYLVNPGATLFGLKCDGSVVIVDFQHLDEFFREQRAAAPDKARPGH